jgi:hypothetical protein
LPVASLDLALPPPPGGPWQSPRLEVRPLLTVRDIIDEGREMHHCVASQLGPILAGRAFIYSLRHGRERITVELRGARTGMLLLSQASGIANRTPSRAACIAMGEWLRALGAGPEREHTTDT